MSLRSNFFIGLGIVEGIGGVFAAAVTGDMAPAVGGAIFGMQTLIFGCALDSNEPAPVLAESSNAPKPGQP